LSNKIKSKKHYKYCANNKYNALLMDIVSNTQNDYTISILNWYILNTTKEYNHDKN